MIGLFAVTVVALWLDTRQTFTGLDSEHVWTALIYGAFPICAALAWDSRRAGPLVGLAALLLVFTARVASAELASTLHDDPWPAAFLGLAAVGAALLGADAQGPSRWSLGPGDHAWWLPRVGVALVAMVGLVLVAALVDPAFVEAYPQYPPARTDLGALLRYQASLGIYMLGWEAFYRGTFLRGLTRRIDPLTAVLVAGIPFFLLHWHKPELEMLSSYIGSVGLGWFCLRARSFWPAFLLHWGLNASMELTCFGLRQGGWT